MKNKLLYLRNKYKKRAFGMGIVELWVKSSLGTPTVSENEKESKSEAQNEQKQKAPKQSRNVMRLQMGIPAGQLWVKHSQQPIVHFGSE